MPDSTTTCYACGRAAHAPWTLPRPDPAAALRFSTAPFCETCVAAAVEVLRDVVRRFEDAPDPDGPDEPEMDMLMLIALLKAHGLEMTAADMGGLEGMAAVCHGLRTILDSLERQLMCSACGALGPESRTHVIPWFNEGLGAYVTTFRCRDCVGVSLDETRGRLRDVADRREIDGLGDLLRAHGVVVHEWARGDSLDDVRAALLRVVEMLRGPTLRLRLGATVALAVSPPS